MGASLAIGVQLATAIPSGRRGTLRQQDEVLFGKRMKRAVTCNQPRLVRRAPTFRPGLSTL